MRAAFPSVRSIVLCGLVAALAAGAGGCHKRPVEPVAPTGSAAGPERLDARIEAEVAAAPQIRSVDHDATGPKHPGDPVTFLVDATVPAEDALQIQVVETDWSARASGGAAGDRYSIPSRVPQDVGSGSYVVRASIVDPSGKEIAESLGARPIEVVTAASCADLQSQVAALTVYFEFDSSDLDPQARERLQQVVDIVKGSNRPDLHLEVQGNCDERGTIEYNLALGDRRANAVKSYLVSLGADASRISTVSYGEERPVNPAHNESAWAQNRRAEFSVTCPEN